MTRLALALALLALGANRTIACAESLVGNWLTEDRDGVITVAPCGERPGLCGRIAGIMLDHPGDTVPLDYRGRSQCQLPLFGPAIPDGDGVYDTTIVDPRDGGPHPATIRVDRKGRLRLRGYVFIPLLGQTQVWTRYLGPLPADCRIARY